MRNMWERGLCRWGMRWVGLGERGMDDDGERVREGQGGRRRRGEGGGKAKGEAAA